MIGAFARMVGRQSRIVSTENYDEIAAGAGDAPPEGFVHKVADEGGDVFFAPMVDLLRESLRRARKQPTAEGKPLTVAPEATTPDQGTRGSP